MLVFLFFLINIFISIRTFSKVQPQNTSQGLCCFCCLLSLFVEQLIKYSLSGTSIAAAKFRLHLHIAPFFSDRTSFSLLAEGALGLLSSLAGLTRRHGNEMSVKDFETHNFI